MFDYNRYVLVNIYIVVRLFFTALCLITSVVANATPRLVENEQVIPFGFYSVGAGVDGMSVERCTSLLNEMAQSGVTFLGPYYPGKDMHVRDDCSHAAAKLGMSIVHYFAIYKEGSTPLLHGDIIKNVLSIGVIKKQIRDDIKRISSDKLLRKSVAWWGIYPEELRFWKKEETHYMSEYIGAIRSAEHEFRMDARPIMMYEPTHRKADDLIKMGKYLNIQAMGLYTDGLFDEKRIEKITKGGYELWSASKKQSVVPIAVLNLDRDFPSTMSVDKVDRIIRNNVFLSLISGARGCLIWSWFARKGLTKHDRDIQVRSYLKVANEINKNKLISSVLRHGEKIEKDCPLSSVDTVVSCYQYYGHIYYFILNLMDHDKTLDYDSLGVSGNRIFNADVVVIDDRVSSKIRALDLIVLSK